MIIVGLAGEPLALIREAAAQAWPDSAVHVVDSVDSALRRPPVPGRELLVLDAGVDVVTRERAAAALAPDGLSRWPVIVPGLAAPALGVWHVPFVGGEAAAIANALQAVVSQHAAMREAARARGDLWTIARRISHEMRSPLGCILTSADVLREELADNESAADALVQPIIESASDLMGLLERLILIARASAVPVTTAPVDMGQVAWSARERLASAISSAGAEITEPDEWPTVLGVGEWLERIWQNLLANALRYGGPNPRIEIGWRKNGTAHRFFVRDHGAGVPQEIAPMLFRPFHQLHQADSGRGLGLALVQRLVELQSGECGYEPAQPRGSCFYFTVPLTTQPPRVTG